MRKTLSVWILLLCGAAVFAAKVSLPSAVTATLSGDILESDITVSVYDENGSLQQGNVVDIEFTFPQTDGPWEVKHTVFFGYSSNLDEAKQGMLSFDLSPLRKDADHVVDTSITLASANPDVRISHGNTFVIDFKKGNQEDVMVGSLTITAKKDADTQLEAGEYTGSITVNMSTSN